MDPNCTLKAIITNFKDFGPLYKQPKIVNSKIKFIPKIVSLSLRAFLAQLSVCTVQLSSKLRLVASCTHSRCIPDASPMHSVHVQHVFWMHFVSSEKWCGSYVSLAAALSWVFVLAWTCLVCALNASCAYQMHPCTRSRHVKHVFQVHTNVTVKVSSSVEFPLNEI